MLNEATILSALKDMIVYCRNMQSLLVKDQDSFSHNDMTSLNESNEQKTNVIYKLSALVNEITMHASPNQHLLENLETQAMSFSPNARTEFFTLVDELKSEIAKCYKSMITNSHVVFSNLHQLKTVWDQLSTHKPNMECVYDHKGVTK